MVETKQFYGRNNENLWERKKFMVETMWVYGKTSKLMLYI